MPIRMIDARVDWYERALGITVRHHEDIEGTELTIHSSIDFTINGKNAVFQVTTMKKPKEMPVFTIAPKINQDCKSFVDSDQIIVTWITDWNDMKAKCEWWMLIVDNIEYDSWKEAPITATSNIIARLKSSEENNDAKKCTITIWSVPRTFTVTTKVAPAVPVEITEPINTAINTNSKDFGWTWPKGINNWTMSICPHWSTIPLSRYTQIGISTNDTDGKRNRTLHFDELTTWPYDLIVTMGTQTKTLPIHFTAPDQFPH